MVKRNGSKISRKGSEKAPEPQVIPAPLCASTSPTKLRSLSGMFEFQSLALLDVVNGRMEHTNARVVCAGVSNLINLTSLQLRYGKSGVNKALSA
jgi:hypothetical protein